jgi:hypothetical protein
MIWQNCAKFFTKVFVLKLLISVFNDAIECLIVPFVPNIFRALSDST